MTLLEIRDLVTGYRGVKVLHKVSLNLDNHERIVIMGPSGSGKSTLLRCIPRLIEPWSGEILFEGIDIVKLDKKKLRTIRSKIGYLPQHYGLFPHMKVIDNIMFPLTVAKKIPKPEAKSIARKYMKMLGIQELEDRYPAQLSGGQQQRVALARALAMDPKLLLLDEPTSALDPESRIEVLEALYRVSKLGKAMIIVTHEVDFALEVADRIVFMENGRIIAEGEPEKLVKENARIKNFVERLAKITPRAY